MVPAFNLPGITQDIKLTGEIIADIYAGTITKWNDKRIAELNSGVSLPELAITPVYRTDGSGTTFVFTMIPRSLNRSSLRLARASR